jgi:hypothetical protein
VYALMLPAFGLAQTQLLDNSAHWVIQAAHLLVGIGALALAGVMSTRYQRRMRIAPKEVPAQKAAPQVER